MKHLVGIPNELHFAFENAVENGSFKEYDDIPLSFAVKEAKEILATFGENGHVNHAMINSGVKDEYEQAQNEVNALLSYIDRWEPELVKSENVEKEGIESSSPVYTKGKKEKKTTLKPKGENKMTNFKWNNRKKATETAVEYKVEKNMSPEEAVKAVLKEFEGVYHVNGDDISETRLANFIKRVADEKKYKKSAKAETPKLDLTHKKIEVLVDKGELTELQARVLDAVYVLLEGNHPSFSDATLEDVSDYTSLKPNQIKGALGHLMKKDYVETKETTFAKDKTATTIWINEDKLDLYNDDVLEFKRGMEAEEAEAEAVTE